MKRKEKKREKKILYITNLCILQYYHIVPPSAVKIYIYDIIAAESFENMKMKKYKFIIRTFARS